jgi:hypothetical protein
VKCDRPFCPQTLWLLGAGWFLLALYAGETELLGLLPPLGPQVLIFGLTGLLLVTYFGWKSFRTAVDAWPDRAFVVVHLTRFIGIYFLVLSARGQMDSSFAGPAGAGDIAVALGALALLTFRAPKWGWLLWNSLGLLDIIFVVGRAAVLRFRHPASLKAFCHLPLSFLPTMIVPLIIATHVVLFIRLLRRKEANRVGSPTEAIAA